MSNLSYSRAELEAMRMQKERGCVIVGYAPKNFGLCKPGMSLSRFAGGYLERHELFVLGPSVREEWDAQCLAMGGQAFVDEHPQQDGESFFVCKLVKL